MSRSSLIAALVAVEVAIVVLALYSMGVGRAGTTFVGFQRFDFTARPIAPISAGSAPHVAIDDPQSGVTVKVSSDGLVHVTDLTSLHGARFSGGQIPQLTAERTGDGVSIVRHGHEPFFLFGSSYEHIEVAVPAGSRVDVAHCESAEVDGVTGGVTVRSQDGHVRVNDLKGTVDLRSDDGYIEASGISGDALTLQTADGHIGLHNVSVDKLTAHTNDGHITINDLSVSSDSTVSTADGSIQLALSPGSNLAIDASTQDGSISVDGQRVASDDSDSVRHTIRLGNASANLRVSTSDGSIHISTNGAP